MVIIERPEVKVVKEYSFGDTTEKVERANRGIYKRLLENRKRQDSSVKYASQYQTR